MIPTTQRSGRVRTIMRRRRQLANAEPRGCGVRLKSWVRPPKGASRRRGGFSRGLEHKPGHGGGRGLDRWRLPDLAVDQPHNHNLELVLTQVRPVVDEPPIPAIGPAV